MVYFIMDIMNLMTIAEFCRAGGLDGATWRNWRREGRAPDTVTIDGVEHITRDAIEDWRAEIADRQSADDAHHAAEKREPLQP